MGRMMVIGRKGAAPPIDDVDETDDGADGGEPIEGAVCPNCACEFDPDSGDVITAGKPVEGGDEDAPGDAPEGYQGAELNTLDDAEPMPGKAGGAHDAAVGDAVMAALLRGARS